MRHLRLKAIRCAIGAAWAFFHRGGYQGFYRARYRDCVRGNRRHHSLSCPRLCGA
jgi:hypothetical protein